jgi:aspartyl-tRNA(Asn)/glutamyl-tRNA(Gln) amidotransferase subunit C|tara:strand:- start:974 stop:1240 length:267 start_codon:yes stop_codon:yes gene_type:complete
LVSEDEIANVAKLMRIDIDDHSLHIKRVQKMLEYFDILDNADIESVELLVQETELENLRTDNYIQYDKNLIDFLKTYKEKYVRAPKMS